MKDLSYGIESVWNTDPELQLELLNLIVSDIRGISDTNLRNAQVQYLKSIGAFYVHTGEYLLEHFGKGILDKSNGIFNQFNTCTLQGRLVFPIRIADGSVLGFIGYSNKPKDWPEDKSWIKYLYPGKEVFNKGRYMFIEPQELEKAIKDRYICIVDGIFDKIVLQCLGINAVSLCGSMLTDWHIKYLSFIEHKIVIADNDVAGRKLYNNCVWKMPNVVEIRQPTFGDIDDYLKTDRRIHNFLSVFNQMQEEGFLLSGELHEEQEKT